MTITYIVNLVYIVRFILTQLAIYVNESRKGFDYYIHLLYYKIRVSKGYITFDKYVP